MPAAEDRANCSAAERPDPCWKIHQKLVASIVPFDIGGPLYRVQRLRLTDLTDTARHPKPLAIAPRIIANADYCFPSAKWTWIEFHRGLPFYFSVVSPPASITPLPYTSLFRRNRQLILSFL